MKPFGDLEVWLLTGTQDLYGDAVLATVDEHARRLAAALDAAPGIPVHIRHYGYICTAEAARNACLEANAADRCIGVIVWAHTFSPGKMWISGLLALRKPLLHLHTQFNRELPWAEIDMDFLNINQSAHGDRELAFIQTRLGVRRKTVVGHWSEPAVQGRVGTWARAACGWLAAQRLRVARFGDNMRDVAVTEGDKLEAQMRLGVAVNGYGVNALVDSVRDASDAEVERLTQLYEEQYELATSLRTAGERRPSLLEAARIEVGLRSFLEAGGFQAFTDTFEDLGALGQLPGIAVQRLMEDGYGFGAEGDWKTAMLVRIIKVMTTGLDGGSSFMEDYTYDLLPPAKVLGAHMLEVCPSIAAHRPSCEIHPLAIGGRGDPVRLVFTAHPGRAANVAVVDLGDRLRLLLNEVEVVTPDQALPRLPVARAVWMPRPDFATAAEAWMTAGGSHHTVLSFPLSVEMFRDFAEIAGVELVVIDGTTSASQFGKELRWNQAWYSHGGRP